MELSYVEMIIMEERIMNRDTMEKLVQLRLLGMLQAYKEQYEIEDIENMAFEQRLTLLVDAEVDNRHNRTVERLIKNAKLPDKSASIEDIKYYPDRQINRELIAELATNKYIDKRINIFIIGATGSGKSYLACALGNNACIAERKVLYIRIPDLVTELSLAKEQGTYKNTIKKYEKIDLLILDEWLLIQANDIVQQYLLEIVERRYSSKATIFCSQFSFDSWRDRLGGGAIAEAIVDRIAANKKTIDIKGDKSMRSR